MPALRGHHLICLHFFNGQGYDRKFTRNLRRVVNHARQGEVEIVHGADAVCIYCSFLKEGKCCASSQGEDEIKKMDKEALRLLGLRGRMRAKWPEVAKKIPGVFPSWHEEFCRPCPWKAACERNPQFRQLASKG